MSESPADNEGHSVLLRHTRAVEVVLSQQEYPGEKIFRMIWITYLNNE
jgi:hypothetical protein